MGKTKAKAQPSLAAPDDSRIIRIGEETVSNVLIPFDEYPGTYSHNFVDPFFDIEKFKQNLSIVVYARADENELVFDLIGIDASVANALRRILIAEVPTVAIEKVYILNNTSIVQDEILAQRLGLIPILVDPRRLSFKGEGEEANDMNTIVFQLKIKCEWAQKVENEPRKMLNENVYSSALQWLPQGNQAEEFSSAPIRPVHPDILIAKLRPGQELDLELHCEKNIGKEHAKWSPVATATYRLLPTIKITSPIEGDLVDKFISCFPPGVVCATTKGKVRQAVVANPRLDTVTREVLRHPEFAGKVELGRQRDYFICKLCCIFVVTVESTGILPPDILVSEALDILIQKCDRLLMVLDAVLEN